MGVTVALTTAIVVAVIAAYLVLKKLNNAIRSLMQRVLGDYFEYASIFYLIVFAVLGLIAFMYFVVPLVVWLLIILFVVAGVVTLLETA